MTPDMLLTLAGGVIALLLSVLGLLVKWIVQRLTQELASTRQAMHDLREAVHTWKLDVVDRMARIETRAEEMRR